MTKRKCSEVSVDYIPEDIWNTIFDYQQLNEHMNLTATCSDLYKMRKTHTDINFENLISSKESKTYTYEWKYNEILRNISLTRTQFYKMSLSGQYNKIDLSSNILLEDISGFIGLKVNELYFIDCFNLRDVSALSSCEIGYLNLKYTNVKDVSGLGHVKELDISYTYVKHVSNLENLEALNLEYCYRVRDVSKLGNLRKINMKNCISVRDVSNLIGKVKDLDLEDCSGVFAFVRFVAAYVRYKHTN